ncbi:ribonuclease P protein component [Candidatus Oleimmundimicrobium sp.]|uniref:ribonuclease P protein component n=1 Tax=Candidatus Oleimmundimicrobium sp. TaxID=3060597 RepID=UPI002725AE74|nr:ribonuclease P protein component [Candidatus Oleimmundimicrobium sp.]MDO8886384.1 ribonuclease P protein component [Candidatus Oleimmundimicrobium sp.]
MMQGHSRLTKKRDFREAYKKGTVFKNKYLVIWKLKKENSGKTRIGYSVGKKLGNAVERNRLKRILKEACRRKEKEIKLGYDLIILARGPVKKKNFSEAQEALLDVFTKAECLKK